MFEDHGRDGGGVSAGGGEVGQVVERGLEDRSFGRVVGW